MDKSKPNLQRKSESSFQTHKKISKSAIMGTIIGTLIASTPILFSLHESVPDERIWNTFLFTYDSSLWESAQYAMWVLTSKFLPLFLLLIWFFTNRNWWYHALLVPIIMYLFQIIVTLSADVEKFDEFQIIYMLPIMAIIIPSIYLIRAKMFNTINDASKTMQELEEEFMMKPKSLWGKVKQYF
jgi:hypothetical protein